MSAEKLSLPLHFRSKHLNSSLAFRCNNNTSAVKDRAKRLLPDCVVDGDDCEISDSVSLRVSFADSDIVTLFSAGYWDRKSLQVMAECLLGRRDRVPALFVKQMRDESDALRAWSAYLSAEVPVFADLPTDFARSGRRHDQPDQMSCLALPGSDALYHQLDSLELCVMLGLVVRQHCVKQEAIIIGRVVENEESELVGSLTNVIPVCIRETSLDAALSAAKQAAALPELPFATLSIAFDPDGCAAGSSRTPLVQICCARVALFQQELANRCSPASSSVCSCEISVQVASDGLVYWFYDRELFLECSIRQLHQHFVTFASSKGQALMSASERELLSRGFCGEVVPLPVRCEMHEQFVAQCPSSGPAVWEAGVHTSYSQLLERSQRVASLLSDASNEVGVLLQRSMSCITAQVFASLVIYIFFFYFLKNVFF